MILASAIALAAQAPSPRPRDFNSITDAEFCAMQRDLSALNRELPIAIDSVTQLNGVAVACALRHIGLNKSVARNLSEMRPGWQAMAQSQLNQIICENALFAAMARRGWSFGHHITFRSGEIIHQTARCPR